jgi:hypothetical protein
VPIVFCHQVNGNSTRRHKGCIHAAVMGVFELLIPVATKHMVYENSSKAAVSSYHHTTVSKVFGPVHLNISLYAI